MTRCLREGCTGERLEQSVLCALCFEEFAGGKHRPKINENDDGPLALAIGHKDGVVVINFGKRVTWIGLPPKEAQELATLILRNAAEAEKENG